MLVSLPDLCPKGRSNTGGKLSKQEDFFFPGRLREINTFLPATM